MQCTAPHKFRSFRRLAIEFIGDKRRVIALPFDNNNKNGIKELWARVESLSDQEVETTLEQVARTFEWRHRQLGDYWQKHYRMAAAVVGRQGSSESRRSLIGACCTMEYSLEAAALFNPSIVPHPDQQGLAPGSQRFVMSLRATGEGHISSIVFRVGIIEAEYNIAFDDPGPFSTPTMLATEQCHYKEVFRRMLTSVAADPAISESILCLLPERFTVSQLDDVLAQERRQQQAITHFEKTVEQILHVAANNYQLELRQEDSIADSLIYPYSPAECHGMEDLRLVRFVADNGKVTYYGTYTAYNGREIASNLLETADFRKISVIMLHGACARNKGMALFPRKIDNKYIMCSRIDGRNLYLMSSDYLDCWESAHLLAKPKYPWELRLIGNCGSPLATEQGWLLLTHGVGPMRRYCIGAMLLDLENPFRIIGRLRQPLLAPTECDRDGYVPNVVYSCGAMVHGQRLYLPYGLADSAISMVTIELDELLGQLRQDGP